MDNITFYQPQAIANTIEEAVTIPMTPPSTQSTSFLSESHLVDAAAPDRDGISALPRAQCNEIPTVEPHMNHGRRLGAVISSTPSGRATSVESISSSGVSSIPHTDSSDSDETSSEYSERSDMPGPPSPALDDTRSRYSESIHEHLSESPVALQSVFALNVKIPAELVLTNDGGVIHLVFQLDPGRQASARSLLPARHQSVCTTPKPTGRPKKHAHRTKHPEKGSNYTSDEDTRLLALRRDLVPWEETKRNFPNRSLGSLKVHHVMLKKRGRS